MRLTAMMCAVWCLRVQWFELRDNEYRYKGGYWQAKAAKAFPIVDLF